MSCFLNPKRMLNAPTLLVISAWLFLTLNQAQANFAAWDKSHTNEPVSEWLTKESTHFTITYPQANSVMADKALNIAERVHNELLPFFNTELSEKTHMVLVDDFDVSNGWATFYPYAQIRLFSSPPDTVSGLEVNDDWLHTLIRHEYVHILHLEMSRGAPKDLRKIFGRVPVLFPHAITPSFMLEGLATYLETNTELGYGRLQGSYYAMQMRTEVAEQRLKSLSDVSAPLRDMPLGMQYLYGSYFFKYLAEIYGEQAIQMYLYHYAGQILPAVKQNSTLQTVIGKRFDQVWAEYLTWLQQQFADQIKALADSQSDIAGRVSGQALNLDVGLFKDAVSSQGNRFYYLYNNGEDASELRLYRPTASSLQRQVQTVTELSDVVAFDINQQQEIVASRLIKWADGRSWTDLVIIANDKNATEQLITHKSRLRNVRWLNNELMIASRKVKGISEWVLLNKQGDMSTLWRGEDETTVIGDFDTGSISLNQGSSKQGYYLIAAIKRANQGWNLERINLHNQNHDSSPQSQDHAKITISHWQPLTQTKAIENSPQILTNGDVIFSADYDGIYNIYRLNPQTQTIFQLTDMLTGAFTPRLLDDGRTLIFQAYRADGFEYRSLDLGNLGAAADQQLPRFSLTSQFGRYNYPNPFSLNVDKTTAKAYSPWASLLPRWWLPYYNATPEATQVGLVTGGSDLLARHNYDLSFGIDGQNELADLSISYRYDNRYQLGFQRSHEYININDDDQPDYIIEQDRWLLARHYLANDFFSFQQENPLALHAGLIVERESSVSRKDLLPAICIDNLGNPHNACEKTLFGLALSFDTREGYLNSPGISAGRYVDLVYESNDALTGISDSDYQGGILQGQWQEYFDLPGRRSLSWQLLAAQADEKTERMTIGGDNRFAELTLFGRDDFALRGYPAAVQGGNYVHIQRLNYNQWLARIDKGWGIWPIGAGDVSADIYIDYGSAWQDNRTADYLTGVGIDLNIEVLAFYNLMLPVRLSVARGLDSTLGETRVGLGISLPY